jgi:hypothetical protein
MSRNFTPAWENVSAWEERGISPAVTLAMDDLQLQRVMMADDPFGRPSCIVYDEDLAKITLFSNDRVEYYDANGVQDDPVVLNETDAFTRQGDKGPYHWAQGPIDLHPVTGVTPAPTPPVTPSPNPEPVKPGALPRKGKAVTTTNLRLRKSAGTSSQSKGVMPTGTEVLLTGGRKSLEGDTWVRVRVEAAKLTEKRLSGSDRWISAPPRQYGWVDAEFLAVPASEYEAKDFPAVTHEFLWFLEDAGGLNVDDVKRTLTAISDDPRGPLRAGIDLRESTRAEDADVLLRFSPGPCGGAAGCYYKRSGDKARVDIDPKWFNTMWLSRVFLHETLGHAATRAYDHYNNAPQYPRPDYYGLMGNWQDAYGDHAWPDEDDIANFVEWKNGKSSVVFVRDLAQ